MSEKQGEMDMNEKMFIDMLKQHGMELTNKQLQQFEQYYTLLVEWNEKVNLTAIIEKEEVYLKHFFDSITPSFYEDLTKVETIGDIGAGAGFPSIPLKICFPHLKVTIVDSLKKRIHFLETLTESLGLHDVHLVHGRAEDIGKMNEYRAQYDLVTARAVARMSVLAEYCLPLCKKGGLFLALKGSSAENELMDAKKAMEVLGGKFKKEHTFFLPVEKSERSIISVKKIKNTPKKYPRKAGTPAKKPIS